MSIRAASLALLGGVPGVLESISNQDGKLELFVDTYFGLDDEICNWKGIPVTATGGAGRS